MHIALLGNGPYIDLLEVKERVLGFRSGLATFMCASMPTSMEQVEIFRPQMVFLFDVSEHPRDRQKLIEFGYSLRPQLSRVTYIVHKGVDPPGHWGEASFSKRTVPHDEIVRFIRERLR